MVQYNNSRSLLNSFLFNAAALPKNNSNRTKKLWWHGNWKKKHSLIFESRNQLLSSICYSCPPELKNQAGEGSSPRKTEPEPPLNV
ncbi:hypothetical protein AHAS_Ahas01G0318700 [Arachis hypogaea]